MNYILAALFIAFICLLAFMCGFLLAITRGVVVKRHEQPELTEIEKIKLERKKREYDNFLNYDGSEQV